MYVNANEIREKVSLVDFLARLGYVPAYKSGKELFYLSMLREEKTASLCVNEQLGVWYDHGGPNHSGIKGGNVIDLALAYWHPLSFIDVLQKIKDICQVEVSAISAHTDRPRKSRPRITAVKVPNYMIEEIKPLGSSPAVTGYLQYRGIWGAAADHLKEVYYYVEDQMKNRKQFFAAGWKNENGGWEIRNKYFKGCLGKKGISCISGNTERLILFEGFLDFLSWKTEHPTENPSILVLNTLSLISAATERAGNFKQADVYFDHDNAGREATRQLMAALPQAIDRSDLYQGYNDYNEKRIADQDALLRARPNADIFADVKVRFGR